MLAYGHKGFGNPVSHSRACRWALQMRTWEIAPPEDVSAGGGRTLHVPGLFLQLSVSPSALCVLRQLLSKATCLLVLRRCVATLSILHFVPLL